MAKYEVVAVYVICRLDKGRDVIDAMLKAANDLSIFTLGSTIRNPYDAEITEMKAQVPPEML